MELLLYQWPEMGGLECEKKIVIKATKEKREYFRF